MENETFCATENEGSMNLILAEVKSLRGEVQSLKSEVCQLKNIQSSPLPILPSNEKAAINNSIKELVNKESALNEFKTFLSQLDAFDAPNFLRAVIKVVLTDKLANNTLVKVIKEMRTSPTFSKL